MKQTTDYDVDPEWKEELNESAWYEYDSNLALDKVKSFKKFLQVREYYRRYSALNDRLFVTRDNTGSVLQEELSPDIFLTAVLQRYNCFAGVKEKERKAMERLVEELPLVSRVFSDPRFETGLVRPDGWASWAINQWKHPVKTTDTKFDDPEVSDAVISVLGLLARQLPVDEEHEQVLCWIAHALQHPERRPQWHLVIRGEGGNGKSTFFVKILRAIFGLNHVNEQTDLAQLDAPTTVSGWLSSLFVVCDDFLVQRRAQADNLKHLMTAPRLESRRYYQNATQEDVFSRFIFISNSRQPLKFVTEDRRFFVPQFSGHTVDKGESARYVAQEIMPLLDERGNFKDVRVRDALLDFFMTFPLKNFDPGVPLETEDHKAMCGSGMTIKEAQIQGFIDRYPVATYKSFRDYMTAEHQTYVADVDMNIWEKMMRESPDKWELIKSQDKVRFTRPVGEVSKGKSFTGWCQASFREHFTDNMQTLFGEDEEYFKTLFPKK